MTGTLATAKVNQGRHETVWAGFFAEAAAALMIPLYAVVVGTWICSTVAVEGEVCLDPDRPSAVVPSQSERSLKSH
jgi:hypothetical protein